MTMTLDAQSLLVGFYLIFETSVYGYKFDYN